MKKILTIFVSLSLFLGSSTVVFAANYGNGLVRDFNRTINEASRTAQHQQNSLDAVIKRSDQLITNRIDWLNKLSTRLSDDKRLPSDEQSQLESEIQTEISNLTNLKTKIDADTTLSTAQADSKEIIVSYRVYAYFIPRIQLLITVNNLLSLTSSLQNLIPNIQNLINSLQSQGKNVTALQSILSDASSTLTTINTKLTSDKTTLEGLSLSSTSYETNIRGVRSDLENIRGSFGHLRADLSQMRQDFRAIIIGNSQSNATSSGEDSNQPVSSESGNSVNH